MMVAITDLGDIFFQFVKGNNNETSVAAFILDMVESLSDSRPKVRADHLLLLDNSSTHKTNLVKSTLNLLNVPTMFTAPASYLAAPVECLFGAMKRVDFEKVEEPDPSRLHQYRIRRLTHT